MVRALDIPEIASLSIEEKIQLIEDLWDSIAADPDRIPVPQSHLDELERRRQRYLAHPEELLTLEEARKELNRRIAARKR